MLDATKFWRGSQSLEADRVVALSEGHRVRTVLKRDAYDHQSYVRAEVWTDEKGWAFLEYWPIGDFELKNSSYTTKSDEWQQAAEIALAFGIAWAADFFGKPKAPERQKPDRGGLPKVTVKNSCGHEYEYRISRKTAVAWLETQVCPNCKRK